ncbi:inner-membrane translocator [Oscillochloris trichoides DG-6]|uniref:Inner-membrane translocator n=1 Tax=Oscillochloris trichoides DG-6 TaxID=765420 RepID=E1IFU8_9CHLR|nr:ABC transporter permease [Oscillochloris trichoides]EFO79941.1 inner-membrane translocator [Oscillochloris trichoides DG-6]
MDQLIIDLAAILAAATPLIFATMGETISERAGVVNLSLDGSMLLAAMIGFAVALTTGSLLVGFAAAAMTGAFVALILGGLSLSLGQSQTAVGFVLALLCTDLSSFLGSRYVRVPGPAVAHSPIPILSEIPLIGPLFFNHDPLIYTSFVLVPLIWWFLFRTRAGLVLRALGDRPQTAHARGVPVVRLRYLYLIIGGALIGIAGAAYSLDLKQGWSYRHTFGTGWIALAIVIFGGWQPWRVAIGCYLFAALQMLASRSQSVIPGLPTQVFQVAPFVLMIIVLALVNLLSSPNTARHITRLPVRLRRPAEQIVAWLSTPAPTALGQPFERP